MFGGGPTHTGVADRGPGPGAPVVWSVALGSSVDSSPAVAGDRVYVGTADGDLCAVSADQGKVLWRFSTGGAVISSPAVAGDRVVFGSVDDFVYCVGGAEGKLLWKYRTWKPVVAPPTVAEGVVYIGSIDGTLTALGMEKGEVRWQVEDPAGISCAPVVSTGWVFYGDRGGTVRARRADSGKQVWEAASKCPVVASPSLAGSTLLVPYMSYTALVPPKVDYLVAYDGATGNRLWAQNGVISVFTTPAVAEGVAYFATVEGYLSKTEMRAVSLADGSLLWKRDLPPIVASSPALAGDYLYMGAGDGALYTLARQTGQTVGRIELATKVYSSPAVSGGRVYVGANDGKLYCVGGP
jgi:outer membrane protein assembly factor BamB